MPSQSVPKTTAVREQAQNTPLFLGFSPPTSNTTYTPNQFFDVVLPYSSRGVVRLVAYILRKTLGWCDAHGNPQETEILVSYRDLEKNAAIGHSMIRRAIDEAIAARFIRCVRPGRAKKSGISAETALFELRWDDRSQYTTSPQTFHGFYAGQGHRTYIPNGFFDVTVPCEPLSVVKLVGAIVRHTIGFQTKYGFRRQQVQMSFTTLQRHTNLSRNHLNKALQAALFHNYILRIEEGFFDPNAGQLSKASVYGVRWLDSSIHQLIGPKRLPEPEPITPKRLPGKPPADHSKKVTGITPKRRPEDRSEKVTDIEIKHRNKTSQIKQQQPAKGRPAAVVSPETFNQLQNQGFSKRDAKCLASTYPEQQIRDQINWLEKRNPRQNRLGMLRRAIEENWDEPGAEAPQTPGTNQNPGNTFASHFYAGYHGNQDAPTAQPSSNDVASADQYVKRLLALWPDESQIASWGRVFGEYAKSKQRSDEKTIVSFVIALRSYGDAFYAQHKARREEAKRKTEDEAEEAHAKEFETKYFVYLREMVTRIKTEQPDDYAEFEKDRDERRAEIVKAPWMIDRESRLERFDREETRLEDFQEFFSDEVLDFWDWDEQKNPQPFQKNRITL